MAELNAIDTAKQEVSDATTRQVWPDANHPEGNEVLEALDAVADMLQAMMDAEDEEERHSKDGDATIRCIHRQGALFDALSKVNELRITSRFTYFDVLGNTKGY